MYQQCGTIYIYVCNKQKTALPLPPQEQLQIRCGGLSGLSGRDILLGIDNVDYLYINSNTIQFQLAYMYTQIYLYGRFCGEACTETFSMYYQEYSHLTKCKQIPNLLL
jgi:hypothetical protein